MSLLRHVMREYLIHRLSRGRHRGYGYRRPHPSRYGYGRHRPRHRLTLGRPHRRTGVHVGGCCLPIPLGSLIGSTVLARMLFRRGTR